MGPISEFGSWLPLLARPLAFGASVPLLVRGQPGVLKLAAGTALALGMVGTAPPPFVTLWSPAALVGELAAGVVLALAAGIGVWAALGSAATLSAGAAPTRPAPTDALGQIWTETFGIGAVAILLTAGAHRPALQLLADSWRALPPGRAGDLVALTLGAEAAVSAGADILAASAALAMPAFAIALLTTTTLCALRAATQSTGAAWIAALAVEPVVLATVVAVVAAAAATGWADEALRHAFGVGLGGAEELLEAWRLGIPR